MRKLTLLVALAALLAVGCARWQGGAVKAESRGATAESQSQRGLAGTAWAVVMEGGEKPELLLFRFRGDQSFSVRNPRGSLVESNWAKWEALGDTFSVRLSDPEKWAMEGSLRGDRIEGTEQRLGKSRTFRGVRVDPDEFEFPLGPGEVKVVIRLHKFVDWGDFTEDPGWRVPGFVLQIVAPEEYAGEFVTAHHDGLLASGDPRKLVAQGKLYYLRIPKAQIGDMSMGTCSADLRLKEVRDR